VIAAAFGMTDDHGGRSGIAQHFGGDVAGVRTRGERMAILTADGHGGSGRRFGEACDQGGRRTHHDVDLGRTVGKRVRAGDDFLQFADRGR
jgi:hypothetical protein